MHAVNGSLSDYGSQGQSHALQLCRGQLSHSSRVCVSRQVSEIRGGRAHQPAIQLCLRAIQSWPGSQCTQRAILAGAISQQQRRWLAAAPPAGWVIVEVARACSGASSSAGCSRSGEGEGEALALLLLLLLRRSHPHRCHAPVTHGETGPRRCTRPRRGRRRGPGRHVSRQWAPQPREREALLSAGLPACGLAIDRPAAQSGRDRLDSELPLLAPIQPHLDISFQPCQLSVAHVSFILHERLRAAE